MHIAATGLAQDLFTTRNQARALRLTTLDVAQHRVHLHFVDQRTHYRVGQQGVGWRIGRHQLQGFLEKLVLDAGLNKQARWRIATLALVEENAAHGSFHRLVQVGAIGKHNIGRLATQFSPGALEVALPRHDMDLFAHACRAGKGNAIDIHVQRQRRAGLRPKTGDHIEYPWRNAGFQCQVPHAQGRQWRLLAGLEHHGVASRQGGSDFPGRHDHGVVPGHDDAHHANRLAGDQCQGRSGRGCNLIVDLVDRFSVPAQAV